MRQSLAIIDGKSIFYRGYYAMPHLSSSKGVSLGGVYGFAVLAFNIINKLAPDYICVAWDKQDTNIRRRRQLYPEYKANRQPAPNNFYEQIEQLFKLLKALNWPLYELDDYEADDIMATFALQAEDKELQTLLISSDLDLLQALGANTKLYAIKNGFKKIEEFDEAEFKKKYGIEVEQFKDLKALMGDASDNIPGVAGVGPKTATTLLQEYKTLDNVYVHLNEVKEPLAKKLEQSKEMAYLSRELVDLQIDAPLELNLESMSIANLDTLNLQKVLREFEFYSLLSQIPKGMKADNIADIVPQSKFLLKKPKIQKHNSWQDLKHLNWQKPVFLHAYCQKRFGQKLLCLLASDNKQQLHVYQSSQKLPQLSLENCHIYGYDTKQLCQVLSDFGIENISVTHDVKVAAFLLNSLRRLQTLSSLAADELDYVGELDELELEDFLSKAQDIAAVIYKIKTIQEASLKKIPSLKKLAKEIEWPFIPVLARLERVGMMIDIKALTKLQSQFERKIEGLQQAIFDLAGETFNLSSPAQLSKILYQKLELPTAGIRRTQTAYSTDATYLLKFKGRYPIVDLILEWRELDKLQNTYVHGLLKSVSPQRRVHSEMRLTGVATGRLSSANPNLQTIPLRTEIGNSVRSTFIAPPKYKLINADYNQFELRLAAVLAQDKELIKAFNKDLDIHKLTASLVFEIPLSKVTKKQRYLAKTINFGVLYGQGARSLALLAGMSYQEAQEFIDKYFEQRPRLKRYLEKTKELTQKQGYIETLFGRRRYLPDVQSSSIRLRAAALRQAINMPIQGTEADLMKMAMIKLESQLDEDCRQIMQVHDSIILECPDKKVEQVSILTKEVLENIYPDLGIKLKVDVAVGQSWPA